MMTTRSLSRLSPTLFTGLFFISMTVFFIVLSLQDQAPLKNKGGDTGTSAVILDQLGSALIDVLFLLLVFLIGKKSSEEDEKKTWLQKLLHRADKNTAPSKSTIANLKWQRQGI